MHQDKKKEELEEIKEFERMQQEEGIEQEAEIEEVKEVSIEEKEEEKVPIENEIERAKRRRKEIVFELALFCILGILLGITIKTEAIKRITIGFNDYQLGVEKERYDIAGMKKNLEQKALEQQQIQQQQQAPQQQTPGQQQ